jgi:hypothetical protein
MDVEQGIDDVAHRKLTKADLRTSVSSRGDPAQLNLYVRACGYAARTAIKGFVHCTTVAHATNCSRGLPEGVARHLSSRRELKLRPSARADIDTGFTDGPNNPSHIRVFDADVENGKLSNSTPTDTVSVRGSAPNASLHLFALSASSHSMASSPHLSAATRSISSLVPNELRTHHMSVLVTI